MMLNETSNQRWYHGISRYQWLVLTIASLGWIFDVFEGQVFVASMNEAMPQLLPESVRQLNDEARKGYLALYNNIAFAAFLVGGAVGGVFFGMLSDRIGRTKTMLVTILMYSLFTCVTAFAQTWWQMAGLRFLVAMGVGGEWAVASAMVAEVFPKRARGWSGAIFHGSSVFGTWMAVAVGAFIVGNQCLGPNSWRWGFAVGVIPALLTVWVRWKLREPDKWVEARQSAAEQQIQPGRFRDLFRPALRRHTLIGVTLAAIGLATFWGVHIYGKNFLQHKAKQAYQYELSEQATPDQRSEARSAVKDQEMLGMFLTTTGGGFGLLLFGPLSDRVGRRKAFILYHVGGLVSALVLFQLLRDAPTPVLWFALPIFGFLTLGMHAGYAIYFPELFPTHLRGTGGGFCFNFARIVTAGMLLLNGWLQAVGVSFENAASLLSLLFLLGVIVLMFAPETKDQELPE